MKTKRIQWLLAFMLMALWPDSNVMGYTFDSWAETKGYVKGSWPGSKDVEYSFVQWVEAEVCVSANYLEEDPESGYYTYKGHYIGEMLPDEEEWGTGEIPEIINEYYYIHQYYNGEFYESSSVVNLYDGEWISIDPPIGPLTRIENGNLVDSDGNVVANYHPYTRWADIYESWNSIYLKFKVAESETKTCEVVGFNTPDFSWYYNLCRNESDVFLAWISYINIPETVSIYENGSYVTYTITGIGDRAFQGDGASIPIESVNLPSTITTIGNRAFADISYYDSFDITLPPHLEYIGDYAFLGCNNYDCDLYVPASVKHIGKDAFAECWFSSIEVSPDNPIYDSRNNCNAIIETSTNTLLKGCSKGWIPEGVQAIDDHAFLGCLLANLELPISLVSIGEYAFGSNYDQYDGIFPHEYWDDGKDTPMFQKHQHDSKEKVARSKQRWGEFSSVIIPENVKAISKGAFYYCGLDTVTSMITVPFPIADNVFNNNDKEYGVLLVPSSSVAKYETTDGWKGFSHIEGFGDNLTMGDVNSDGKVNVLDLATLVNYINGKIPAVFARDAANLWKDDKINVQDLVCLVGQLMDMGEGRRFSKGMRDMTQESIMAEAFVYCHDGQLVIDSKKSISAFDIVINDTYSFKLSQDLRQQGMTCQRRQSDNHVHIIGYSLTGGVLPAGVHSFGMVDNQQSYVSSAMLADQDAMEIATSINGEASGIQTSPRLAEADDVYQITVGSDAVIHIKANGSKYLKKHSPSSKDLHR